MHYFTVKQPDTKTKLCTSGMQSVCVGGGGRILYSTLRNMQGAEMGSYHMTQEQVHLAYKQYMKRMPA